MPELTPSFVPAAKREAEHERRYYQRVAGMGAELLAALAAALSRSCAAPEAGSLFAEVRGESIRGASMGRFPFHMVYVARGRRLVVLAVAHDRRRPLYWLRRLR